MEISTYQLSKAQEGIWLDMFFNSNRSASYNIGGRQNIKGSFSVENYKNSLDLLLVAVPQLRMRLTKGSPTPSQYISNDKEFTLSVIDCSEFVDPIEYVDKWIASNLDTKFELFEQSLFRIIIFKITDSHHIRYFLCHHLMLDAKSIGLVNEILTNTYNQLLNGKPIEKMDVASYIDYIKYDLETRSTQEYSLIRENWKHEFTGKNNSFQRSLGQVKHSSIEYTPKIDSIYSTLPIDTYSLLLTSSTLANLNPSKVLVALSLMSWSDVTKRKELFTGLTYHGRNSSKLQNIIGMLTNVIPIFILVNPKLSMIQSIHDINRQIDSGLERKVYRIEDAISDIEKTGDKMPTFDITINSMRWRKPLSYGECLVDTKVLNIGRIDNLNVFFVDRANGNSMRIETRFDSNRIAKLEAKTFIECIKILIAEFITTYRKPSHHMLIKNVPIKGI